MRRFDQKAVLLLLAVTSVTPAPLSADDSASMNVRVQVIARAIVNVSQQPAEIVVTEADVARGYVDVAEPLVMHVRSNSPRYLLQIGNQSRAFKAVELTFGDTASMVVTEESWIARPSVVGEELVSARMRVRLVPGATAGRHALPLQVSAIPLQNLDS